MTASGPPEPRASTPAGRLAAATRRTNRDVVRERSWTLRRRLGVAFAAVSLVIAVLVAAVVAAAVLFTRAGNEVVYRWQPANAANSRLLSDLVSQETGVRGYALSKDAKFLDPYERFTAAAQRDTARLWGLVGDDGRLRDQAASQAKAIDAWRSQVARPAIAAIRGGDAVGAQLVESAAAKDRFDAVRQRAAALAGTLADRTSDARSKRRLDGIVFGVAGGLLVVVVFACGLVLWRGLHHWVLGPVDRLAAQTREVARGRGRGQIVADGPQELTALGHDVEWMHLQITAELARAEDLVEEVRVRSAELARSNDDLQQFAYVASHDLSEPLRKVANFCQLLERQYGPELDDRARQYIGFAVDGAKRMQVLITDLLALSRVGRSTEDFAAVDLDAALDQALANLGERMTDANARVERDTALPTVHGDRTLLTSLLQNLVGNAVKYRRDGVAPVVSVRADGEDGGWTFTVADNGIGIDAQYAERIFVVFQRLHLRDEFGGTGIGLALCRKIVEFHGGRIWLADVESASDGATFRFTLPEGVPACRTT